MKRSVMLARTVDRQWCPSCEKIVYAPLDVCPMCDTRTRGKHASDIAIAQARATDPTPPAPGLITTADLIKVLNLIIEKPRTQRGVTAKPWTVPHMLECPVCKARRADGVWLVAQWPVIEGKVDHSLPPNPAKRELSCEQCALTTIPRRLFFGQRLVESCKPWLRINQVGANEWRMGGISE